MTDKGIENKKTEFYLQLVDNDPFIDKKLEVMNKLEVMFDDCRFPAPDDFYFFSDEIPKGSTIKVTLELVNDVKFKEEIFIHRGVSFTVKEVNTKFVSEVDKSFSGKIIV